MADGPEARPADRPPGGVSEPVPQMSVLVLGCDGSWTGPSGAGSGYLVTAGSTRLLLDCGPGTFANLQRFADPATVDALILSHHHPDHWTDLYALATHARYVLGRRGIPVHAPAGLAERARLEGSPALEWHTVAGGDSVEIGGCTCTFRRTDHGGETLAVVVEGAGRRVGYSADSGPGWTLSELGKGLDLVVCEATYTVPHEGTAGHLSGRQAGDQGRLAGARRLVITHRWPTIDPGEVAAEAAAAFGRPVEQAEIGREYEL